MKIVQNYSVLKYFVNILPILVILLFTALNATPSNCETEIFKIDREFLSSNFSKCEVLEENSIRLYLSPEITLLLIQAPGLPLESQLIRKQFM